MSYVSRIVIVRNADGSFSNAAIHESEVVGGKTYDLDPRAINASDVALLTPYLNEAAASAVTSLTSLNQQITSLTNERDASQARVAELEKQLAALTSETNENGVPLRVSMATGRIALSRAGKLTLVKEALAAMPGQAGEEAREWFEYSSHIERRHPTVIAMTPLIGTEKDVDNLFITAEAISKAVIS